jgi:ABC-type multidrug transport system ATPase subunit
VPVPTVPDVVVEARQLTKHFGPVVAVEDLDLDVRRGEVFGFLGPNGAGKTTTIRLGLDLVWPTAGSVRVLGSRGRDLGVRRRTCAEDEVALRLGKVNSVSSDRDPGAG